MPFLFPYLRFIVVTFFALLLLSGCFRSAGPDLGVPELRDETEKLSLQQAQRAFLRADYSTAVQLLNRFLHTHPQSPRLPEVRWWLARAYQKNGQTVFCSRTLSLFSRHPDLEFVSDRCPIPGGAT